MLLSRGQPVSIIRHSGVIFEGEQGRKYASAIGRIIENVQGGLEEVHGGDSDGDDVRFMRIRTKRHEIMISPAVIMARTARCTGLWKALANARGFHVATSN